MQASYSIMAAEPPRMQRIHRTVQGAVWIFEWSGRILARITSMMSPIKSNLLKAFLLSASVVVLAASSHSSGANPTATSEYSNDAQLKFPDHYREWVYLSSGFDMSYSPAVNSAMNMDHHMFDNVFVNPEAYKSFVATGTWPDKTMLVLEHRGAEGKGSINRTGNYQSVERMDVEVHVKDEKRFPGKWVFFGFDNDKTATAQIIPASSACYSCHAAHAAVDTTFVQFYPTLLPLATIKHTLNEAYGKDNHAHE